MVRVMAALGKPKSAAMPADIEVVDAEMTAPSAPRAVSVLSTPTETTDGAPLTVAAINGVSESTILSAIRASAASDRLESGALEKPSESLRSETSMVRACVLAKCMVPLVEFVAVAPLMSVRHARSRPVQAICRPSRTLI